MKMKKFTPPPPKSLAKKVVTDDAFMQWAESWKPCRYCDIKFLGPVCPCEDPFGRVKS